MNRRGRSGLSVIIVSIIALLAVGGGVYAAFSSSTLGSNPIDLQKGLFAWYKFNGNAKDSTSNRNHGTVNGATLTADRKGRANSAYFVDSSQTISIPDTSALRLNGSWSISFWHKDNGSTTSFPGIVMKGPNGGSGTVGNGWMIFESVSNNYLCYKQDNTQLCYASGTATSTPGHYLITYDGTTLKLFLNGTLATSAPRSFVANTNTNALQLGRGDSAIGNKMIIDDLRFWNRAISTTEVAAMSREYDASAAVDTGEKGLLAWWKLDGNAKDSGPSRINGTPNGAILPSAAADRKATASGALYFNDNGGTSSANLNFGTPSKFANLTTTGFTYSIWLERTAASTNQFPILMGSTNTHTGFGFRSSSFGNDIGFEYGTTPYDGAVGNYNRVNICTTGNLPVNQWHLFTASYSGSVLTLYKDGVVCSSPTTVALNPAASAFTINTTPSGFNGYMDDARVYGRAITATEVSRLYASYNSQLSIGGSGASGSVSLGKGLVGDWALNDNTKDSTPNRVNGTLSGAPTLTTDRKGRTNSGESWSP